MKIFLLVTFALITSSTALSQTQRRAPIQAQTERELISLGQKAVLEGVRTARIVVDDRFTGNSYAVTENRSGKLIQSKVTIAGDRALVTGRVSFSSGLLGSSASDPSSPITIRFMERDGQWRFAGLCVGGCP